MRLDPLGTLTLSYSHLTELSYESGGQVYGALEGTLEGPELRGRLHVTNLAPHRTDGEFAPTLRGTLTAEDGKKMFVTIDGISILEAGTNPPVRIGLVALTFRSADPKLKKWNGVFAVAEYRGQAVGETWGLVGTVYRCVPEGSPSASE
jgi:hypothetical protein